jgi:DNA invertase Pin-like site-specific DNA recombinase
MGELEGLRCLVPCRLSQKGESQTGLDSQDQDTRRWIKAEGGTVIAMPKERVTGTRAPWERKELGPWMTDPVKRAQYDAIVVAAQDRLSRAKWRDESDIRRWAEDNRKVIVVYDTRLHWPPRPGTADQVRWEFGAISAREEWEKDSQRYKRMQRQLRENNYLTGKRSYGHRIVKSGDHKILKPDEKESAVIIWAADRYLEDDWSLARICRQLEADGKPAPNAKGWNPQTLARIFHNPVIAGRRQALKENGKRGKTVLRVKSIIDRATFDRLQAKMESRAHRAGVAPSNTALLTGILFCGYCRGPMYRLKTTVKGKAYTYYRCRGSGRNPSTCKLMIPLDETEQHVDTLVWEKWGMEPYKEVTVIPGTNYEDEIDAIKQDFNDSHDAEDEDYLDAYSAMMAEVKELRDKRRKPDEVIEKIVPGLTRADVWMMGPAEDQRRALMRWGLKLYAYRTGPKTFELRDA